jgi:deoxyribodipyrimidine photo-lyase
MAAVTSERWHTGRTGAALALASAARVRSVDDPHLTRWLKPLARLDAAPMLFPAVERHCSSFSQWWTRATRGSQQAGELL